MNKMNIAITGATGFIGQYAVEHFKSTGHRVIALGRSKKKLEKIFDGSIEKYATNYSEESLKIGLKDVDFVIHLAAELMQKDTDPLKLSQFYEANLRCTENLLIAACDNHVSTFIHASSISVYSMDNELPFTESDFPVPANIYGVSKACCEQFGNYISSFKNINIYNLRLARLFGYGERKELVLMKFIDLARNKLPLKVWGNGEKRVDYIYVKDVVNAFDKVFRSNAPSGSYNIGSGQSYSILEIAKIINNTFDNPHEIKIDSSKNETYRNIYMGIEKANKLLNWKPEYNLYTGLKDIKKIIKNIN